MKLYEVPGWGDVSEDEVLALVCPFCDAGAGRRCVFPVRTLADYPAWWGIKKLTIEQAQELGYPHHQRVSKAQEIRRKRLGPNAPLHTLHMDQAEYDIYLAKQALTAAKMAAFKERQRERKRQRLAADKVAREMRSRLHAYVQAERREHYLLSVWLGQHGHILWGEP